MPEQMAAFGGGDIQTAAWGEGTLKEFVRAQRLTNWGGNVIENIFTHYALKATAEIQMEENLPTEESPSEGKGLLQRVEKLQVRRTKYIQFQQLLWSPFHTNAIRDTL